MNGTNDEQRDSGRAARPSTSMSTEPVTRSSDQPPGTSDVQRRPGHRRGLITRIPIWVTVSGILALLLVGLVVSSTLLGGSQMGGMEGMDHKAGQSGPAAPSQASDDPGDHTPTDEPGDHTPTDDPGDHTPTDGPSEHR